MSHSRTSSVSACVLALGFVAGCARNAPPVAALGADARMVCPGASVHGDRALAALSGCRRIEGDLALNGVSSLEPLASLERVDGTLAIQASAVETLTGLEQLRSVGGLALEANPQLDDVSALESLETAKRLSFVSNRKLSSPSGLSQLTELDELVVRDSAFLSLRGLEGLTRIDRVQIQDNAKLISLRALNNVRFSREVVLSGNPIVCGSFGVLAGLTLPPLQVVTRNNFSLRAADLKQLRAPATAPDGIALR